MHKRLLVLPALLLVTGCSLGRGGEATTSTAETTATVVTTTAESPPVAATVFRLHGERLRAEAATVRGPGVAAATLAALGLPSPVSIDGGTARVSRDDATAGEVAEIVYTLTQFPSVRRVDVAGRTGLTRADVADFAPVILVESPLPGATVGEAFEVRGTASVYEATLVVELRKEGKLVQKQVTTASEGAPARGTFSQTMTAPDGGAYVVAVYSPSAVDGSAQHEADVPVTVMP